MGMRLAEFAQLIGKDLSTVHRAVRQGRLAAFVARVRTGPRSLRGVIEITDPEAAAAAFSKGARRERSASQASKRTPAWYGHPECYELGRGNKTLNLRRLSSNPALASRWIDEVEYPADVQRPCRRGDCAPAGSCPHCQASPVAPRVKLPAGEGGDAPARLLCPRCGGEIRWGGADGARRWEKANPGEPAEDARELPAAVLATTRPCPFAGCRHHMAFDVKGQDSLTFSVPGTPVWEMVESCSLDVAERSGGVELRELPALLGRSFDRSFQLVDEGLLRAREVAEELGQESPWERSKPGDPRPRMLASKTTPTRRPTFHDLRGMMSGVRMPTFRKAPHRELSREEVARLYPGAAISADFGKPRPQPAGPDGTGSEGAPGPSTWAAEHDRDIKGWRVRFALTREARRRLQEEARRQDEPLETPEEPGPGPLDQGCTDDRC